MEVSNLNILNDLHRIDFSRQQKPFGFGAQGQQQQPFPSNNLLLSNQQREQPSISDAFLMSSQRFIPPRQPLLNNGW